MSIVSAAITGDYEVIGELQEADCIIGLSFGSFGDEPGSVNALLADYIASAGLHLPIIVQGEIADSIRQHHLLCIDDISKVIRGNPSTSMGNELDSWRVLQQAKTFMKLSGLSRPVLFAQAHHVGRVTQQAITLMMNPIVPSDLPKQFDISLDQWWTHNRVKWACREIPGLIYLKMSRRV